MYILHLSDLHFGTLSDATNWYSQLADDLVKNLLCRRIEVLILSGDLANRANEDEYKAAEQFLDDLCREFRIKRSRIVIVPGNHDVNWLASEDSYHVVRTRQYQGPKTENGRPRPDCAIEREGFVEVLDPAMYPLRFKEFADFYQRTTLTPYPSDYAQQGIVYDFSDLNLVFLGLNSAWQLDHYYTARASIHPDAISTALTSLRQDEAKFIKCYKLAVWHHPINSPGEDRLKDLGFLQRLAVAGFSVGFHGHIHKVDSGLYRYDQSTDGRKLEIVGAGTFGAPIREWTPGYPLQYNLLRLTDDKLTVETRARKAVNGAWEPDAIWQQGEGKDPLPRYTLVMPALSNTRRQSEPIVPEELTVAEDVNSKLYTRDEPTADVSGADAETDVAHQPQSNQIGGRPTAGHRRQKVETKRVLIVAVNPVDSEPLRLDKEVREISNILRSSRTSKFEIDVRWAVRLRDLRQAFMEIDPDIIHFCGHGGYDAIILEDDRGFSQPVLPDVFASMFALLSSRASSVTAIFNACYMESQVTALAPYVDYVIGMDSTIEDNVAIAFSCALYQTLASGHDVETAFQAASSEVRRFGRGEETAPILQRFTGPDRTKNQHTTRVTRQPSNNLRHRNRILFVTSNPQNTPQIRVGEELREIYAALDSVQRRSPFSVEQRWGTRLRDFSLAIVEVAPKILHFTGHGTQDGLVLENDNGDAVVVSPDSIVDMISTLAKEIDCIIFNASYSDKLAYQLRSSASYAIGWPAEVADIDAILFSSAFYRTLAARRSVQDAFKIACLEVRNGSSMPENLPRIYTQHAFTA